MTTASTALVGYAAAAVGSFLMLPQAVKTWRTRRVDEISVGMLLMYVSSCLLWVTYGAMMRSGPLILANGIGLAIGSAQLAFKFTFAPRR